MFWLTIGILVGIYLDQTFTIPPLRTYLAIIKTYIEQVRKSSITNHKKSQQAKKKDQARED